MTAILRAITWEFWRENRWWIIVSVSAILGLGGILYGMVHNTLSLNEYDADQMLHLTIFFWEMIAFGIFLCLPMYNKKKSRFGFPERLFTKPVRLRSVASIRLGLAMITAISLYIVTAWVFNWATDMHWPIALPCLYMATCIVFVHAMVWSLPEVPGLQVIFSVIGYFVLCFHYIDDLHTNDSSRAPGFVVLIALWAGLALAGAALDRRSQRITLTTLWNRILKVLTACLPWKTCTKVSPQRALFWFHWIRKGWILPVLSAMLMILGYTLLWSVAWREQARFINDYFTGIFLVHVFGFPLLISMIICQQETQNQGLATYTSSLPVTNHDMLIAYLKASLASLAMAWGIFVTGLCVLQLLLVIAGKGHLTEALFSNLVDMIQIYNPIIDLESKHMFQIRTVYFLVAWTTPGLLASIILTGRRITGVITLSTIFLLPAIPAITDFMGAPRTVVTVLYILEACLFILGIIGGTIAAYMYGTLQKRISPYLTLIALLVCVAVNIINIEVMWREPQDILESLALLATVTLALTPFATAPLALAWNRHR